MYSIHEEDIYAYTISVRKRRKDPLGRLGHRWKDNIKVKCKDTGYKGETGFNWLTIGSSGRLL